jgi:hypothetical protein
MRIFLLFIAVFGVAFSDPTVYFQEGFTEGNVKMMPAPHVTGQMEDFYWILK